MEQEIEQNKSEKDKKISIDKENPKFFKVLLVIAVITGLLQTLMTGRGNLLDFVFQFMGALAVLIGISWIIGIIPVFILRNKMKNARITIYGVIFLFLCSLLIISIFL